ncbi:hypothetical protein P886_2029 [Alteromonadaceae bacterium 2753L.S.0a.02]|nr:hypothetical protein P886_2029 [Alteromonadaceae bacterium 2753L.S.0a.02]
MSSKKTAVFVRDLVPGVPQTIETGCEFVFIERARELTIVADSNRMTGRRSGDNLRFDQPVKAVTIESTIEQRVELVLGFGDFNRLIIEGRLVLDDRIETNRVGNDRMPVEFTKTFGLVTASGLSYIDDALLAQTATYDASVYGFSRAFFEWDYKIYLVLESEIRVYDYAGTLLDTLPLVGSLDDIMGGDVDPQTGNAFIVNRNGISRVNLYTGEVFAEYASSNFYTKVGLGARMVGRELVFNDYQEDSGYARNQRLFRYNVDTNQLTTQVLGDCDDGYKQNLSYDPERGELLQSASGSIAYYAYDHNSGTYLGARYSAVTHGGGYFIRKKNVHVISVNNRLNVHVIDAISYAARLYIQDGQDVASRREYNVTGNYSFTNRGTGVVIRGNVVSAILQGLDVGGGLSENYLDYVQSLKYTDGYYSLLRDAGSASFAYRGYDDVGELLLESEATIKLLPQYLTAHI